MTIDYKAFAAGGGANVITQADYVTALAGPLANGFVAGLARSASLNKVWRQSSVMTAAIADYIVAQIGGNVLDDGNVAALATLISNAIDAQITASATGVPVGGIIMVPATAATTGFLKVNGALVSRATYADLWTYAQASGNNAASDGAWTEGQFSPGDGSTTFRLPDARGNFLRAWADGRAVDTGRAIGSSQTSQNLAHTHQVQNGGAAYAIPGGPTRVFFESGSFPGGAATDSNGGSEARPINIAWLVCIKY